MTKRTEEFLAEDRPATYRAVFAVREFRALFGASLFSWLGDGLAKIALAALVYDRTRSVFASAATMALGYLPWIVGGPLLSALAERYPYRRVMIVCDVSRAVLIGAIAVPGAPLFVLLTLLFAASMLAPPFESARSALLPQVLSGDRYVVALSLQNLSQQSTRIAGFALGGALSAIHPWLALVIDSATFAVSAHLIWRAVTPRTAAVSAGHGHLLREAAQGFQVVFGNQVLRSIALLVFGSVMVAAVPEALAAGWSATLGDGPRIQGVIMAGIPVGMVLGGTVVGRMLTPSTQEKVIRALALLIPMALLPAWFTPGLPTVLVMVTVCGFGISLMIPANGLFVRILPDGYRARAFGVMQGGIQVLQGLTMVAVGAAADVLGVAHAVGITAVVGLVAMVLLAAIWPSQSLITRAIGDGDTSAPCPEVDRQLDSLEE